MSYNPKDYWSKRIDPNSYETNNDQAILNAEKNFVKDELKLQKNICVIGPGNGRILDSYSEKNITFVDITTNYKDKLEKKFKTLTNNKKKFDFIEVENIDDLSIFKDNQFEALVCVHVLLHVPKEKINKVLKELTRICKKLVGISWFYPYKTNANHVFVHDFENHFSNLGFKLEKRYISEKGKTRFVVLCE